MVAGHGEATGGEEGGSELSRRAPGSENLILLIEEDI